MYSNFSLAALTSVFLFSFIGQLNADTLYLKNGHTIEGLIKNEDEQSIDLELGFGTVKFSKSQIERIYKSDAEEVAIIKQKWKEEKLKVENRAKEEKAKEEFRPKQVKVDRQSGHIVVEATLNKKVKASLVLDTGASFVVLSNNIVKKLGIDAQDKQGGMVQLLLADGRKIEAKYIVLDSLCVEESEAKNVGAAILPEDVQEAVFQDGLLGMSFLKKFNFKIDQKNNKLILEKL